MKKKGFTLVELLAVVIILAIIILITIPIVNNVINESKEDAYMEQKNRLIEFAQLYTLNNDVGYDDGVTKSIPFQKLIQEGLLLESPVDPRTGEYLSGCVTYTWSENMGDYAYELESDCTGIPEQVISVTFSGGANDWTKTKQIGVIVNNYSGNFLYCTTIDETCTPTEIASNGSAVTLKDYTSETAKVCVMVEGATVTCSNNFKLDNTGPSFTGVESIIVKTGSTVNLYENITVSDLQSGVNGSYTVDSSTLNLNTPGSYTITYTATDNIGNTSSVNRTIIVGDAPVITFSPNGNTDWSTSNINVNVNITVDSNITYSNAKWCSTSNSNCTPTTTLPSSGVATLTQNSASNRICVSVDSTVGSITSCSDTYKIDKQVPTLTAINSSVTVMGGSDIDLKTYFNTPTYGISGEESFTCNYTNVNQLSSGNNTITCTATGNNGLSTSASIIVNVQLNMLVRGTTFNSMIKSLDGYDTATNMIFEYGISSEYNTVPDASKIDVSLAANNSIVAYVVEDTIKVQSEGLIYANNSAYIMFSVMSNLTTIIFDNFDSSRVTDMTYMFRNNTNLTTLGVNNWDTSNVVKMRDMFYSNYKLTNLDVNNWDTSSVTDMQGLFYGASSLTTIDVSKWNTSSVTDMSSIFYNAKALISLDVGNWDTSSVTDMSSMFYNTISLISLDVSNWDTSSVTDMSSMFSNTSNLTSLNINNWDTSSVTTMVSMFYSTAFTSIDINNWDTSSVTNMQSMFSATSLINLDINNWNTSRVTNLRNIFFQSFDLISLNVSSWDTSSVTNMNSTFSWISNLTSLDISEWNTSKVTNMSYMFYLSNKLTSLDVSNFDTSNVTNMNYMFYGNGGLTTLNVSNWDTSKVISMNNMFSNASFVNLNLVSFSSDNLTGITYLGASTVVNNNSEGMFSGMVDLKTLDISGMDFALVNSFRAVFFQTPNLTTIYVKDQATKDLLESKRSEMELVSTANIVVK